MRSGSPSSTGSPLIALPYRRLALQLQLLCLAVIATTLVGCGHRWNGNAKSPGSAIWLAADTAPPEASKLSRLAELGVGEVFLEAARLDTELGRLIVLDSSNLLASTPTTLVIGGQWHEPADVEVLALQIAHEIQQLRFATEGRGAILGGVHFDLHGVQNLESYGRFLARYRKELDRTLLLSASIRRDWLTQEGLEEVASAVDFVVAHLYGQLPREKEDPAAWDFIRLEQRLQELDQLGVRYMVGLTTLGTATLVAKNGTVRDRTTEMALAPLLWDRRLKLKAGFSLEGINRQAYTVVAERMAEIKDWTLRPGDQIRVVRPVTSHIEEFQRLRGAWNLENLLGQVYYRIPRPKEDLSLSLDNLIDGLDPTPASPRLSITISLQRRTARGWLFRLALSNGNGEVTELSLLDGNHIQLSTGRGRISRVDVGDFYRFVLFRRKNQSEFEQTFRNADTVRLHLPLIEGHQTLTSGDIEIVSPGREPQLTVHGNFILTDGRDLTLGPLTWKNGRMTNPAETGAPPP